MSAKTYDSKKLIVAWGGIVVRGTAPGVFINIDHNEDTWTLAVGSDGEGARSRSNNNSGRVTITMLQTSLTNQQFSQQHFIDRQTGAAIYPLLVKNVLGLDLYQAATAWLVKPATATFGNEIENREWILESDNLEMFSGGAIF